MRLSLSAACKQVQLQVNFQGNLNMEPFFRRKDKVVVVMGATGTGKSRLAIDLATRFPAEIVNSDKMQMFKGLDLVTNKVTEEECRGVPHHLLGIVDPDSNFTSLDFNYHASAAIDSILGRDRLPIIAGGSNSYIEALASSDDEFRLRTYECCFLWVDVSLAVLHGFVTDRVDRMVRAGMIDEVRRIFDRKVDYSRGIRRAIGVPELHEFLEAELDGADDEILERFLQAAVDKIKENTCGLASRQVQKINRLRNKWDWNLHRLDASEALLRRGEDSVEAWEKFVVEPSTLIVDRFLHKNLKPSDSGVATAMMGPQCNPLEVGRRMINPIKSKTNGVGMSC